MENDRIKIIAGNLIDKTIYIKLDKNEKIRYYYFSRQQFRYFPIAKKDALKLIVDYKFSYEKKENSFYDHKY